MNKALQKDNKEIISEYLKKYFLRDPSKCSYVPTLAEEIEENHLEQVCEGEISDKLREILKTKIAELETIQIQGIEIPEIPPDRLELLEESERLKYTQNRSKAETLSSEISEYLEENYGSLMSEIEDSFEFIEDLEKFYKLFKSKGIEIGQIEIISTLAEIMEKIGNEESEKMTDKIVDMLYEVFAPLLKEVKQISNPKSVIFFMMSSKAADEEVINEKILSKLFDKLGVDYKKSELNNIIKECKEEFEIALFEESLSLPKEVEDINIDTLSGHEFEDYLRNIFRKLGYTAVKTKATGDQGADLILSDSNEKIVVQAKRYRGVVSNKAVQEVVASIKHYRADRGIVVTTGSFTKSAIELALSNKVDLWDGKKIRRVIKNLNKI